MIEDPLGFTRMLVMPDGEWVKYSEAQAEITRLKNALIDLGLDACKQADDTIWVSNAETLIDRIYWILGKYYNSDPLAELETLKEK